MAHYNNHYCWGDPDILRQIVSAFGDGHLCVVDVACGPNVTVPRTLFKRGAPFTYVAVDIDAHHLHVQRRAIRDAHVHTICGSSSALPLKASSVNLFIFHHAIDDILETEGMAGIESSIKESLRVTTVSGAIVLSHCVFDADEFTKKISLRDIERLLLDNGPLKIEKRRAKQQEWLIARV